MRTLLLIAGFFIYNNSHAQTDTTHLYDPNAKAEKDIASAVKQAKAEKKFVLLEAGGNWCSWCKRFNKQLQKMLSLIQLYRQILLCII